MIAKDIMHAAIHTLVGIPLWLAVSLAWIPLFLIGIPLVALAAWREAWHLEASKKFTKHAEIAVWNWRWMNLYGNAEDGVTGDMRWWPTYCAEKGWKDERFCTFMWSAIRNPVNNFRFTRIVDFGFDQKRLRYVGNSNDCAVDLDRYRRGELTHKTFWFYAWHGMYPAFWLIQIRDNTAHTRLRLGWKITPAFRNGIPETDYRTHSESFTPAQAAWRRNG